MEWHSMEIKNLKLPSKKKKIEREKKRKMKREYNLQNWIKKSILLQSNWNNNDVGFIGIKMMK